MPINHEEFDRLEFALRAAELKQGTPEAQQLRDKIDAVNDRIIDKGLSLPKFDLTYEDVSEQKLWGLGEPVVMATAGDTLLTRRARLAMVDLGFWPELDATWVVEMVDRGDFETHGADAEQLAGFQYLPVGRAQSMLPPPGIISVRNGDVYQSVSGRLDWDTDQLALFEQDIDALTAFLDAPDFEIVEVE